MALVDQYPNCVAEHSPARPALVCGSRTVGYADLSQRVGQVSTRLQSLGLPRGSRIAWLGPNCIEFVELMLGAAAAGMVIVPLNWRLAAPELRAVLLDADPSAMFCAAAHLTLLTDALRGMTGLPCTMVDESGSFDVWRGTDTPEAPLEGRDETECFLQLYTSGTTGLPKGVRLTHRAFSARRQQEALLGSYFAWGVHETILVAAPMFHIAGTGWLLQGLHHGATCVIHAALEPAAMLAAVTQHRIQRVFAPPVVLNWMVTRQREQPADLSHLRLFLYGSAPIAPATLRAALEAMPGCGFMHHYGMTEMTGSQVCMAPMEHDPNNENRLLSCGRPMPGVDLRIVDANGAVVATGASGEIELRSDARMQEYWRNPLATANAFHDGWYRTGDVGRLDTNGYLYILDRVKDMVVTGGENVYPVEVENVLMEHPAVASVAVIGRPHELWGESLHAVIERRYSAQATAEEFIAFLRGRIAGYKIPRSYEFIARMPVTASGKIKKHELRDRYWAKQSRRVS